MATRRAAPVHQPRPLTAAWKLGRVLTTGNCVVLKLTEQTPLTPLRLAGIVAR